eukprot:11385847-Alexandrium_andersonii.AAC.1
MLDSHRVCVGAGCCSSDETAEEQQRRVATPNPFKMLDTSGHICDAIALRGSASLWHEAQDRSRKCTVRAALIR